MSDLVFYRNDGLVAVGEIAFGKFVNTGTQTRDFQNVSIMVPATFYSNELLLYRSDGLAEVSPIHPTFGFFPPGVPVRHLRHNWSKIIPVEDSGSGGRHLLFYRNDGIAAVGHFEPIFQTKNSTFVNTDSVDNFTADWSHIVVGSGQNSNLLFYRNDGRVAVGRINDGKFVNTFSGSVAPNWSKIVSVSEPSDFATEHFLFYNNDGSAAVGHIEGPTDELVFTDSINNFTENWSQLVVNGTNLLFYQNDGRAAVGHIALGKFVNTDSIDNFSQNWSQIIVCKNAEGQDDRHFLFYRNDGRAAVGHIHFGKFVNTDAIDNLGAQWSLIVNTPLVFG